MVNLRESVRTTLAAIAAALIVVPLVGVAPVRAAGTTVVSLTFDDGAASTYSARDILATHGMHGTFYINSGLIGSYSYYMSWAQVQGLASDGNEIAGHTSYHVNLPLAEGAEAQRQICADRNVLLARGYAVTSFAYPYGGVNASVKQMAQACGYNSARTTAHVPGVAESLPPADPYAVGIGNGSVTLDNLKNAVTAAIGGGGGWVPIMFHDVCNGCTSLAINETDLSAYLDWLQQQSANGVVVQTVAEVVGGGVQAAVQPPAAPAAPNGWNGVRNASLEQDSNGDSVPDCFTNGGYGVNSAHWTRTTTAHSGSYAHRLDVTTYSSGDNKLMVLQDLGSCTPSVVPGHRYVITSWYTSTAPVYFTAYARDQSTAFPYWTASPTFPASGTWVQARWTSPVIPSNVTGLTFGLTLASSGSLTIDDVGIDDAAASGPADTTPPSVSLTSPGSGATVSGVVQLAAQAADNVRLDHVDFLVDNQVVGSQVNAAPSFGWSSSSAANGEHTFAARAVDTSGNATTSPSVTAFVSNPVAPNLLQNGSLETASGSTPTCWALGGFGNNTFAWTRTSDAHTGSFGENVTITAHTTGDRKMVNLQDSGACAPAVTPGHTYTFTGWYKATSQPYVFTYYRNAAGNWVFWTQSGRPVASSWTKATYTTPPIPSGATRISIGMGIDAVGSITMDDFSLLDNAPINPDTTAPTTSIICNNSGTEGGCATGYYPTAVAIQLTAVDNVGGSGVSSIRYTTNGTDPSLTNGTVYAGQFDTTTTVKYRAYDKAGNAEPIRTQQIQIDAVAPTATVTCDGAACATATYNQPVVVALQAADSGGSGVASIRYTTDGSDPTGPAATTYDQPFTLAATTTVRFVALDNAGNVGTVMTQLVQVDSTTPTVAITAPLEGATVTGSAVTISADASDDVAVTGVDFLVDGISVGTSTSAPYSVTWDTTGLADGPVSITATATDSAGNRATSTPIGVTVVNHAPTVALTDPLDGATVSGTQVAVAATASDAGGVSRVDFYSGATFIGSATSEPYSITWDTTTGPDGPYVLTAQATNTAGFVATSAGVSVTVRNDTAAPTVDVTAPAPGATVSGTSVAISATASDGTGVTQVEFLVGATVVGTDTTAPYSVSWDSTSVPDGAVSITARATDPNGNVGTSAAVSVTVRNDTTAPTVAVTAPADGATISGSSVVISATASDGTGVTQVEFLVGATVVGTDTTAPYSVSWDSTSVPDGAVSITARATDTDGNVGTSSAVSVTVRNDTTAPTVAVTAPAADATVSGSSVPISATASDASGVTQVELLVGATVVGTDTTAPYSIAWDSTTVPDGSASITARATDPNGNVGTSSAVSVTVRNDTTAPTVAVTAPAAGATVSGTSVALDATASDGTGVTQVEFLIGSTVVGRDTTAPYSITWDSTSVADGNVSITARATDPNGNVGTSSAVTVTVRNDLTPPTVAIMAPTGGSTVSGTSVPISATASDGTAVTQVEFLVGSTVVGTDTTTPYAITWNSTSVPDGNVSIMARATDPNGNVGTSSAVTVTVRNDTTPPSAAVTAPAPGATVSGTSVPITATASDGTAVTQVQFLVGSMVVGTDTTAPYAITWNSTTVPDGNVSITARATDPNGNVGTSAPVTVTVRNVVAPTITNASLETDANSDGTPDCFAGSGTGKSTVTYARVTDAHTGTYAERMTVSAYKNGVRRFEQVKDAGPCAVAVTPGQSYTLGVWFKGTAGLQITTSYRNSAGTWVTWVTSPAAPASAGWTQLTFQTPAVPAGATRLSFGVTVASNATVTLDDWSITAP
jgi:peptidoglycan/xylan/chitin deacetylase (PgdA/CDA1 family)